MVDSIKTPLDQRHLHVNDNSRHDTFTRNNAYVCARRPTSVRFLLKQPFQFANIPRPSRSLSLCGAAKTMNINVRRNYFSKIHSKI